MHVARTQVLVDANRPIEALHMLAKCLYIACCVAADACFKGLVSPSNGKSLQALVEIDQHCEKSLQVQW